jgi:isopentenyldiphosphate isomerase
MDTNMKSRALLDVVNEDDEVIGQDTRENAYKKGLLHRDVHVWFVTPKGEVIFQHRSKDKDIYPDLLDSTVGGGVDTGMSYFETALKETFEETGLRLDIDDLKPLKKLKSRSKDKGGTITNNILSMYYAYLFKGEILDLKVEKGKAIGFEAYRLDDLLNMDKDRKIRFVPIILQTLTSDLYQDIKVMIKQ